MADTHLGMAAVYRSAVKTVCRLAVRLLIIDTPSRHAKTNNNVQVHSTTGRQRWSTTNMIATNSTTDVQNTSARLVNVKTRV
ncbi:hypothetical protein KIN20_026819 [Parelaphostrongylus tenuis]|uniref:Uncharacterized protein n=1 Tax=Parelaphostrongylus tenuis TaxID=148309 RepID=A0AAD5QYI2_PARTN|nr:hypothetical protein KIN20_026819 [Parelaphostrongylus tenuis]